MTEAYHEIRTKLEQNSARKLIHSHLNHPSILVACARGFGNTGIAQGQQIAPARLSVIEGQGACDDIRGCVMATFVLVHGGGHGGWCYNKLTPLLRAAGHNVFSPTLTGLGERRHLARPDVDLDTHITDIVNVMEFEDLDDVILLGHSYGGMVITGVADRAHDRIRHLVYLDAAHPANGEALADIMPEAMAFAYSEMRVVDGVEFVMFPDSKLIEYMGVTDPDDYAWMKSKITPQPWKCFTRKLKLQNEAAVRHISRTSIYGKASAGIRPADKPSQALGLDQEFEIDTGHDMMITEPRAVADMLLKVAAL
jgi:pimeloyl-ACP methyl ester carboxylesterase